MVQDPTVIPPIALSLSLACAVYNPDPKAEFSKCHHSAECPESKKFETGMSPLACDCVIPACVAVPRDASVCLNSAGEP